MIPTPGLNTTANAMAHLDYTNSSIPPISNWQNRYTVDPSSSLALPVSAIRSSPSGFMHLAPEIRNAIYGMLLETSLPVFIVAADRITPNFRLRERSDQLQYEVLQTLRAVSFVSQEIRREARTIFYASKHFFILPYGYEYLPVFVHWLDMIGADCRAVVCNVCFAGYMWYQGSATLTQRFHDLLRSCRSLRVLTVQVNIWHLCECCIPDLAEYLNFDGPEPHDGPMPEVNISTWADTILQLPRIQTFRLDIVMSVDRNREPFRKERNYMDFVTERCRALVEDIERRLRVYSDVVDKATELIVRFGGTDEREYFGRPWQT